MAAEEQIPTHPESIASGVQSIQREAKPEDAQALVPVFQNGGISQLPLSETLRDIGQIRSEAAMLLLCSHASRLESDLKEIKKEKEETRKESERWMLAYHQEKENGAVLNVKLQGVSRIKNIQKFVGVVGGVIAGVAIPFLIVGPSGWGLAGTIVGVLLLIAGFWPSDFNEIKK